MTIKATKPAPPEPFRYDNGAAHTIVFSLLFVGNINGAESWARIGSGWNRLDILGMPVKRKRASKRIGRGFRPGDAFVHYSTGERLVVVRQRNPRGVVVYRLREMRPAEQVLVTRGIRSAERELRWRRGSYCEDARRAERR